MSNKKHLITGRLKETPDPNFFDGQALATGPLAGHITVKKGEVTVDINDFINLGKLTEAEIRIAVWEILRAVGYKVVP